MRFKKLSISVAALILFLAAGLAEANSYDFESSVSYQKDLADQKYSLKNLSINFRVWTDSLTNGANFDTVLALWNNAGELLEENNDDYSRDNLTIWDSGIKNSFKDGHYLFMSSSLVDDANGGSIAQEFLSDSLEPVPNEEW